MTAATPLALANPKRAGDETLRVIDPRNAFIMDHMMQDVTRYGTAARAARIGRTDLAGKTGTTNEFVDAWFAGYQPNLVGISWMGFDQPKTLGRNQTGGVVALPIWIGYMEKALKDIPESRARRSARHRQRAGAGRAGRGPHGARILLPGSGAAARGAAADRAAARTAGAVRRPGGCGRAARLGRQDHAGAALRGHQL